MCGDCLFSLPSQGKTFIDLFIYLMLVRQPFVSIKISNFPTIIIIIIIIIIITIIIITIIIVIITIIIIIIIITIIIIIIIIIIIYRFVPPCSIIEKYNFVEIC